MMHFNTVHAAPEARLLETYCPGSSFFLASPRRTLLTQGVRAVVPDSGGSGGAAELSARAMSLLREARRSSKGVPVVVGAVPFDPRRPARLVLPASVHWSGALPFEALRRTAESGKAEGGAWSHSSLDVCAVPEPAVFKSGVERGIARMKAGELDKVVLSRTLHVTAPEPIDVQRLLEALAGSNPYGYTFAFDQPEQGVETAISASGGSLPGRLTGSLHAASATWIGASPELLLTRTGESVVSNPLAGSTPRAAEPAEDRARAEALLRSPKDRREHAFVVEAVADALRPYCRRLDVPAEPSIVQTAAMSHLSTIVRGELADPSVTALELAAALHPTPAVCGTPTELARRAIGEIEPFDRGFYTGMVGWCNADGDGEWVVTIRCAEVKERTLRLFAGAGIVAESSPEAELAETSAKFRTMLTAMGL